MPPLVRALAGIAGVTFVCTAITMTSNTAALVFALAGAALILTAIGRSPNA
jgi:hypothetical protein